MVLILAHSEAAGSGINWAAITAVCVAAVLLQQTIRWCWRLACYRYDWARKLNFKWVYHSRLLMPPPRADSVRFMQIEHLLSSIDSSISDVARAIRGDNDDTLGDDLVERYDEATDDDTEDAI